MIERILMYDLLLGNLLRNLLRWRLLGNANDPLPDMGNAAIFHVHPCQQAQVCNMALQQAQVNTALTPAGHPSTGWLL